MIGLRDIYDSYIGVLLIVKLFINKVLNKQKKVKIKGMSIKYLNEQSFFYEYQDIFHHEIYQPFERKDAGRIIDCGSYIGVSVLFFNKKYKNAQIISFEPDPAAFKTLKTNLKANKIKNVDLINAAVSDKNGITTFNAARDDGGSVFDNSGVKQIRVKSLKLSRYINEPIDILKLNVEGMECAVIKEIEAKLSHIKEIIIEYHNFGLLKSSLPKILSTLEKNNFNYLITDPANLRARLPVEFKKNYQYFNLIYARDKKQN